MTLDQRIDQDLNDLYKAGIFHLIQQIKSCQISAAAKLSMDLFGNPNELSVHGLPGYFTGKRDAETVMVMLNPGNDVISHNNPFATEVTLNKLGMSNSNSYNAFITSFMSGSENFGVIDYNRLDNFDIKQAAFLKPWPKSGVNIPNPFPTKNNKVALRTAKANVLMQKLQLELVPYASREFKHIKKNRIKHLFPYVETLFEEVFLHHRKYVILCSDFFDKLFKEYNKAPYPGSIDFDVKKDMNLFKNGNRAYCTPIRIHYHSNSTKAVIAHTFPNKSLPNAYNLMEQYGAFCHEVFTKSTI